jgi:hypothetical protein
MIVTNTGETTALNVHAILPSSWVGVVQDASDCKSITPHGTCTLLFSSTEAYIAKGDILISGDNITNPPSRAFAFTAQGYLVFDPSGGVMHVIDNTDLSNSMQWGVSGVAIGPNAQSTTNGAGNTDAIQSAAGPTDTYAAKACYDSDGGNGTWYLPAVCQISAEQQLCQNHPTIATLVQLGFVNLTGIYWSSTESYGPPGPTPLTSAWVQNFSINHSEQYNKTQTFKVRCARVIFYQVLR